MAVQAVLQIILYVLLFSAMYVQIFFLISFFEKKKMIFAKLPALTQFPTISVIIPAWNEEAGIEKTVRSIRALDYPQDNIQMILVDDGSTDRTYAIMQSLAVPFSALVFTKQNGGKYTALNLGLEHVTGDFVAVLDADSRVLPDAFKNMMPYFANPEVMAVIPAALTEEPTTFIERAQKIEYNMAVFFKKILALLNALHVTPGTLPIYRREVFTQIGNFREGHKGEDMEIAFRMHQAHMIVAQCHTAVIYTYPPKTVRTLFRQRVRWIYAYIRNVIDYRSMIFGKYKNFSWFSLPAGILSIITVVYLFWFDMYKLVHFLVVKAEKLYYSGFHIHPLQFSFDFFYVGSKPILFLIVFAYVLVASSMIIGYRMVEGRIPFSFNFIRYIIVYSLISPFWLMKAVYKACTAKTIHWR